MTSVALPVPEFVDVGGLRIGFRRAGAGPLLLLLHGAVCDSRVWRGELASFGESCTVVAWDAPGCGTSTDPPVSFRMPDFADVLAEVLERTFGAAPAHVLGHSWGSTLALELYRRHPDLVRSLILVGGYAGWAGSLPPDEVARRLAFAREFADAAERGTWDPTTMPGLFSDRLSARAASELKAILSEARPTPGLTMASSLAEADLRPMLGSIAVPTLLVHGDADERSPLAVGEALHAAIPGSTLAVLPGLGHECPVEDPPLFQQTVVAFLRDRPAAATSP